MLRDVSPSGTCGRCCLLPRLPGGYLGMNLAALRTTRWRFAVLPLSRWFIFILPLQRIQHRILLPCLLFMFSYPLRTPAFTPPWPDPTPRAPYLTPPPAYHRTTVPHHLRLLFYHTMPSDAFYSTSPQHTQPVPANCLLPHCLPPAFLPIYLSPFHSARPTPPPAGGRCTWAALVCTRWRYSTRCGFAYAHCYAQYPLDL